MNLLFLTPPIHDLPTGGNVYNRKILGILEEIEHVRVDNTTSRIQDEVGNLDDVDVVIVDSLLAEIKRPVDFNGLWCLLVHYLTICDPSASQVERRRLEREWLGRYDRFVTTSQYTKNCLIKAGIADDHVHVVYPGLEDVYRTGFVPGAQSLEDCKLLTVANILPGKGLEDSLELLESLAHLSWTWDIVGDGSLDPQYTSHFMERLEASPVSDRVFWEGPQEEDSMPFIYRMHDLLLVCSHFETLGMSIREAMASGLPVIAYNVGGIHESLLGGGGVMIDPFHKAYYREELNRLIIEPQERSALGEQGLLQSQRFPTWKTSGVQMIQAMELNKK